MSTSNETQNYGIFADIGGTNARLATMELSTGNILESQNFETRDFSSLENVFLRYRQMHKHAWPSQACLAVACPVRAGSLSFTNSHWHLDCGDLRQKLDWHLLEVINDFHAQALAIPILQGRDLIQVGGGDIRQAGAKGILGPGTGLGVGGLCFDAFNKPLPLVTEGGHCDFAPTTSNQVKVWEFLQTIYGHVSNERLLSGFGILNIYAALLQNHPSSFSESFMPTDICQMAIARTDPIAVQAFDMFFEILGSVAGNLALMLGAEGGIYISGGIVPQYCQELRKSSFRQNFEAKGRYKEYLSRIPTFLVKKKNLGLIGTWQHLTGIRDL